jgi:HK97 family phage prohead protease
MEHFTLDGKAVSATELEDGSLLLEGFAVVFAGLDRQNENFAPGCLARACKAFLAGPASLCFHHKTADVLGKVLEMSEVPGVGIRVKARVDGAIKNHPTLDTLYQQIKNGTLTGLSLGGYFKRAGNKIVDVDPTELSVTGVPVHTQPAFAVVSGKALQLALIEDERSNLEWFRDQLQAREDTLADLEFTVNKLQLGVPSRR